jgi:hypothetical protein
LISLNYISCVTRVLSKKTMHFMVIVKNLLSLCVEFEILLYFLLFYRLWSVNKDVNVRNEAWSEMNRTYTKKSSEKHFWTRITDHNNGIRSLVRAVKKVQKLQTAVLKLRTVIIGARSVNLRFLMGIKRLLHHFVPDISQLTRGLIPRKKEEEEHNWRII